jgi:hypothetical protein
VLPHLTSRDDEQQVSKGAMVVGVVVVGVVSLLVIIMMSAIWVLPAFDQVNMCCIKYKLSVCR